MKNEILKIFTGTLIDSSYICNILEENGIQYLIRNFQEESLVAGWVGGFMENAASVYVLKTDYEKAMLLLEEIKDSDIEMDYTQE